MFQSDFKEWCQQVYVALGITGTSLIFLLLPKVFTPQPLLTAHPVVSCLVLLLVAGMLTALFLDLRRILTAHQRPVEAFSVLREMATQMRTKKLPGDGPMTFRASLYELWGTFMRARRRWPRQRVVLRQFLRRRWTGVERFCLSVLAAIDLSILGFDLWCHRPLGTTVVGLLLANLLLLIFWIAGSDDDEGGQRRPRKPVPAPVASKALPRLRRQTAPAPRQVLPTGRS